MLVKFVLDEVPSFRFLSVDVPDGFWLTYVEGDEIFDYLNENLHPSDVDRITIDSDGVNGSVIIIYELDENIVAGMPPFDPYEDESEMPF